MTFKKEAWNIQVNISKFWNAGLNSDTQMETTYVKLNVVVTKMLSCAKPLLLKYANLHTMSKIKSAMLMIFMHVSKQIATIT